MRDGLILKIHQGTDILEVIRPLAHLRMTVFREYPYLYEGSEDYEQAYLTRYAQQPAALVGTAWYQDTLVGATTAQPLANEMSAIQAPFLAHDLAVESFLYLGESLVLQDFRGKGLGHAFFDMREQHAQALGLSRTTFCAVDRPEGHPLKPRDYRSNDLFWTKRGYVRQPHVTCQLTWQDVDQSTETQHSLTFWIK